MTSPEAADAAIGRRVRVVAVIVGVIVVAGVAAAVLRGSGVFAEAQAPGAGQGAADRVTPVRSAPVTRGSLTVYLRYSGELVADTADLSFKVGGRIEDIRVRIGDAVERGALLAAVDDRTFKLERQSREAGVRLAEAREEQAGAELEVARRELERTMPLADKKLVADQAIDELKAKVAALGAGAKVGKSEVDQGKAAVSLAAQQIQDAKLVAPFGGVVTERYLDPGALVQPSTRVLRLVAEGSLRARFRIPERDLGSVAPDQSITLGVQALRGRTLKGHVTRIAGEVAKTDRSAAAEAVLDEPSPLLKSGMYAEITIAERTLDQALLVPAAAVLLRPDAQGAERAGVFVLDGAVARWKPVEILGREGDLTAVTGSVDAGQQVLVLGHEQLGDGDRVLVGADKKP